MVRNPVKEFIVKPVKEAFKMMGINLTDDDAEYVTAVILYIALSQLKPPVREMIELQKEAK